jgi:heavy metal sensor kinase
MFNSVRIRLTLWYTGAMTLALVILAIATYAVIKQNVVRRADATAVELANSFLATVNAELRDPETETIKSAVDAAIEEHKFQDVIFVVLDSHSSLVGASEIRQESEREDNPNIEATIDALRSLASNSKPFHFVRVGEHGYRSYVHSFSVEQQTDSLIVLQSLHHQNEFLETLAGSFSFVIPFVVILASVGGYLLARSSLSPVVTMSAQASRIGAENLHERLHVENPRDELGQLAASFNELLDRVNRSFERQRRFVADASHELRTPIAILCGEAEVTLSQPERTQQEYRESLDILREEAKRLKHIVEDLFTLARADAGQYALSLGDFYLDELVSECCRNVRALASAKQIAIGWQPEKELAIHADETLIRRMLLNLLDNAIKYTPAGGKVCIQCIEEGAQYRLSIEDSGSGIPADLQARVFERFFRADKARSRTETDGGGAGLGLAITAWIAEVHGGKVELTRSGAAGSLFTVFLPKITS